MIFTPILAKNNDMYIQLKFGNLSKFAFTIFRDTFIYNKYSIKEYFIEETQCLLTKDSIKILKETNQISIRRSQIKYFIAGWFD